MRILRTTIIETMLKARLGGLSKGNHSKYLQFVKSKIFDVRLKGRSSEVRSSEGMKSEGMNQKGFQALYLAKKV